MATGAAYGGTDAQGYKPADVRDATPRTYDENADMADFSPSELVEHAEYLAQRREHYRLQARVMRERQEQVGTYLSSSLERVQQTIAGTQMDRPRPIESESTARF